MRRWAGRVVAAVVIWLIVVGYAMLLGRTPHVLALATAVAAVLAVVWLCMDALAVTTPPEWGLYLPVSATRTFDPRFSRLSQLLADAADRRSASKAVHTSVADVADTLLRDKYGVDLAGDPDAARTVLGEEVWAYLAVDPAKEKDVFSERLLGVLARLEAL